MNKIKSSLLGFIIIVLLMCIGSYEGMATNVYEDPLLLTESSAFTPPITDVEGNPIPGSIASLEKVVLNGVEQWILIRGNDTGKPVILFLHGGPGAAHMIWRELFITPELEEQFVVVLWDQRGAGKSYSPDLTEEDMWADIFVEDVIALTNHLRARFEQEKIFLLGHSWGSALGFLTMMKHPEYPELYHAYIAAGEAADWNQRQTMSYEWTREHANKHNNGEAITALEELQPFDPTSPEHIGIKNTWLAEFGGEYHRKELYQTYMRYMGEGPEYNRDDVEKWMQGAAWSEKTTGVEARV